MIQEVHQSDHPVLSPEIRSRLAERAGRPRVTPRVVEILELVSQGLRDKEIAEAIGIIENTVYVHMKNIPAKLVPANAPPPSALPCTAGSSGWRNR